MLIMLGYLLAGIFAGIMSGLIGIGGGLVVVPFLAILFKIHHVGLQFVMHMAIGTSLAVMVVTTIASLLAHMKDHIPFWSIYWRLLPGVIVGAISGAILAHFLHSRVLSVLFGIFVLLVAFRMLFERKTNPKRHLPGMLGMSSIGFGVGALSSLLGIGGGALTIPFFTYCNVSLRIAVVVSIAVGLTVAVIGTFTYSLTGLYAVNLPRWSTGYIYWPAWFVVGVGSILFAPIGAYLSRHLSTNILKKIFAIFLIFIGIHMLW